MTRLFKSGVVREVEGQLEIDRLKAMGYEELEPSEPDTTDPATPEAVLHAMTVPQLKALCDEKGVAVPGNALKPAIITLLLENGYGQ